MIGYPPLLDRPSWTTSRLTAAALGLCLIAGCNGGDQLNSFSPDEIALRESGDLKELLDERLVFTDAQGVEWTAPQGTLTDGASVPRIALTVTDGRWDPSFLKAAVVHDAYCQSDNETRAPAQYRKKRWQDVHRMFHEAMLAGGTAPVLAKVMFAAVWLGGPRWDESGSDTQTAPSEALTRGFSGAKEWIEKSNPSIEEIERDLERRRPLAVNLYELETSIERALEQDQDDRAAELMRRERSVLERELQSNPDDAMLRLYEGHFYKNSADLSRKAGRSSSAEADLSRSEATFRAVIDAEPDHPSAISGLATTAALRGDLDRAEALANEALRLAPESGSALKELDRIDRLRLENR